LSYKNIYFAPTPWAASQSVENDFRFQTPNRSGIWQDLKSVDDYKDADFLIVQDQCSDSEILNSFKQLIQPFIQNSDGDMRIAAEILTSENATDVKNIIHRIQEQREAKMEQEQVRQQQMQQQQIQAQQTVEQEKMKLTKEIADNKNTTIIEAANIQSNTLRNANDVNDDGQSDFIELELMKQKDGRDTKLTDKKIEQMELQNKKLEKEIKFIGKTTKK
jgi:hypothetical protein